MGLILLFLLFWTTNTQICCDPGTEESCQPPQDTFTTSSMRQVFDTVNSYFSDGKDVKQENTGGKDVKSTQESCDTDNTDKRYTVNGLDDIAKQAVELASSMIGSTQSLTFDTTKIADILNDDIDTEEESKPHREDVFEYHPMYRRDAVAIGHIETVELPDGRTTTIKTLAKRPPVFEIENFLSDTECDKLVDIARRTKQARGQEMGDEDIPHRRSNLTRLKPPEIDEDFLSTIHGRISAITKIPEYMIEGSEQLKVGQYDTGGFYDAHLDANGVNPKEVPCCFHKPCYDNEGNEYRSPECCSFCRYVTFLYYLNDVEAGGETAFPLADMSFSAMTHKQETRGWSNLTKHCYESNLLVKPVKGKAIYWYNRFLDNRGYLGGVDRRSYHGGCNVKTGTKWIGLSPVSSPIYEQRFQLPHSINITESYRRYVNNQRKHRLRIHKPVE